MCVFFRINHVRSQQFSELHEPTFRAARWQAVCGGRGKQRQRGPIAAKAVPWAVGVIAAAAAPPAAAAWLSYSGPSVLSSPRCAADPVV